MGGQGREGQGSKQCHNRGIGGHWACCINCCKTVCAETPRICWVMEAVLAWVLEHCKQNMIPECIRAYLQSRQVCDAKGVPYHGVSIHQGAVLQTQHRDTCTCRVRGTASQSSRARHSIP
jgi:hypothetical protein